MLERDVILLPCSWPWIGEVHPKKAVGRQEVGEVKTLRRKSSEGNKEQREMREFGKRMKTLQPFSTWLAPKGLHRLRLGASLGQSMGDKKTGKFSIGHIH